MTGCRQCGKPIIGTTRKEFCDDYCRGAYHRHRYRQQAVEEAEDRRDARINGDGGGTEEERKQASEVLRRIVEGPKLVRRI